MVYYKPFRWFMSVFYHMAILLSRFRDIQFLCMLTFHPWIFMARYFAWARYLTLPFTLASRRIADRPLLSTPTAKYEPHTWMVQHMFGFGKMGYSFWIILSFLLFSFFYTSFLQSSYFIWDDESQTVYYLVSFIVVGRRYYVSTLLNVLSPKWRTIASVIINLI